MHNSAEHEIYPAHKCLIVGILTFISRINDWLWQSKPEILIDFGYFSSHEQFTFHAQLTLGPGLIYLQLCSRGIRHSINDFCFELSCNVFEFCNVVIQFKHYV